MNIEKSDHINESKDTIDHILGITVIVAVSILFLAMILNIYQSDVIMFYCLSVIFGVESIIKPVKDVLLRRKFSGRIKNKVLVILKFLLGTIFIYTLYLILMTTNYELYYTYWIFIIALTSLIITNYMSARLEIKDKAKKFLAQRIFSWVFFILSFSLLINYVYSSMKIIQVNELVKPSMLTVIEYNHVERKKYGDLDFFKFISNLKEIEINDKDIIEKIYTEIEHRTLINLRNTSRINYERMHSDQKIHYIVLTRYDEVAYIDQKLENGYVNRIDIYLNGFLVIRNINKDKKEDKYMIKIPQEIIEEITEKFEDINDD